MPSIQSSRPGFVSPEYIARVIENVLALLPPVPPTPWIDIADKPTEFPPASHNHTISNVFGLEEILSGIASVIVTKADLVDGTVPASQLPSYVDDVLEFANLAAFPATGETGKIYINIATNEQYRWSGSAYIKIVSSPGSSDAIPEGATNKYYTDARAALKANVSHNHTIAEIVDFPSQSGNNGLYLKTNGTTAVWAPVPSSADQSIEFYDNGSSQNVDWNNGNLQKIAATGNLALTFSNPTPARPLRLVIFAGAADRVISFPATSSHGVVYQAPSIMVAAGRYMIFEALYFEGKYHWGIMPEGWYLA